MTEEVTEVVPPAGLKVSSCSGRPGAVHKVTGIPQYMYMIAAIASLNSINYGFDVGVSSGVGLYVQEAFELGDVQVGWFFSTVAIASGFGAPAAHWISDRFGRKGNFLATQFIAITGMSLCAGSVSYEMILLGRVIVGISVGIGMSIDPMYISESAPAQHRGKLTTWAEMATNIGIALGYFFNWLLQDLPKDTNWRAMLLCGTFLPTVLIILALTIMPESPRWLITKGRSEEAKNILKRTVTHPDDADIDAVVDSILKDVEQAEQYAATTWRSVLCPSKQYVRTVWLAIFIAISQQINGLEGVLFYAPTIFERAGAAETKHEQFVLTMLMGLVKILCIGVAIAVLDSLGRRPALIFGSFGMTLSLVMVNIGSVQDLNGILAVVGAFAFVAFFSIGFGPVCWLYASELFPSILRSKGMSLCVVLNRAAAASVNLFFLPSAKLLGGQAQLFGLYAAITAAISATVVVTAVETKGKTLEEISAPQVTPRSPRVQKSPARYKRVQPTKPNLIGCQRGQASSESEDEPPAGLSSLHRP